MKSAKGPGGGLNPLLFSMSIKRKLTVDQIHEAKLLKGRYGITKRALAVLYGIGSTTVWENVFYSRVYRKCTPCPRCEICLNRDIIKGRPSPGFRIQNMCIGCYLETNNLKYEEVFA